LLLCRERLPLRTLHKAGVDTSATYFRFVDFDRDMLNVVM